MVVLTKQEGKILEEGSISIFDEYGKQSAKTRFTRERSTFDEHYCHEDDVYAKVTTGHLQKNVRALSRTLQTRGLAILLRALAGGQEELKSPNQRKNKKAATASSPASLNPQQSPRPLSSGEKSRAASTAFMATKVGKILSGCQGEDDCAVRFTGAPGKKDRTTVETMNHLLSSKGIFSRRNTVSQSHAAVRERVTQNEKTKFFFSLPTSSVSRLVVIPASKPKRGEHEVHVSALAQGDIVAAPYNLADQPGVEHYLLGEVGKVDEVEKTLSINFFTDGESDDFPWHAQDTTKILKVNDVTAGDLFKTCGALAIGRSLFVGRNKNPAETDAPDKGVSSSDGHRIRC